MTRMVVFWLCRDRVRPACPGGRRGVGRTAGSLRPERHHRRVGRGCSEPGKQDPVPPRVPPAAWWALSNATTVPRPGLRGPLALIGSTDDLPALVRVHSRAPRRDRLPGRVARADARRDPRASGQQRSDRHRPAHVRGPRDECALHTLEGIPLVGLPSSQLSTSARFLKRSLDLVGATGRADLARAGVRDHRGLHQARLPRTRFLPPGADGGGRAGVPGLQVPDDGRTTRRSGRTEVAHLNMHVEDDPRMFKVPNDPRVTRVGRVPPPQRGSTSSRSFSTCFTVRCHSSARARSSSTRIGSSSGGHGDGSTQAGHDGPLAGPWSERHPLRRDDEAGLPVRDELVAARGPAADHAHACRHWQGQGLPISRSLQPLPAGYARSWNRGRQQRRTAVRRAASAARRSS